MKEGLLLLLIWLWQCEWFCSFFFLHYEMGRPQFIPLIYRPFYLMVCEHLKTTSHALMLTNVLCALESVCVCVSVWMFVLICACVCTSWKRRKERGRRGEWNACYSSFWYSNWFNLMNSPLSIHPCMPYICGWGGPETVTSGTTAKDRSALNSPMDPASQ